MERSDEKAEEPTEDPRDAAFDAGEAAFESAVQRLGEPEYLTVPDEHVGLELDEYLCLLYPQVPKGRLRHEVRCGHVLVDGDRVQPSMRLRSSQVLIVKIDEDALDRPLPAAPEEELSLLYEDEHLACVDKSSGIAVEPERWFRDRATLAGALLARARAGDEEAEQVDAALEYRPRILHRLDKETSGALLVAKDLATERALRGAFERGAVRKRYLALVEGEHPLADGERETIALALGPDPRRTGRMQVRKDGKPAVTEVEVCERFSGYTLLACYPLTGRTHQIRVHLAAAGFPLAVDRVYGRHDALRLSELKRGYKAKRGRPERPLIERSSLHAAELRFELPRGGPDPAPLQPPPADAFLDAPALGPHASRSSDGRFLSITAPLHADFERALKQLRKHRAFTSRHRSATPRAGRPRRDS